MRITNKWAVFSVALFAKKALTLSYTDIKAVLFYWLRCLDMWPLDHPIALVQAKWPCPPKFQISGQFSSSLWWKHSEFKSYTHLNIHFCSNIVITYLVIIGLHSKAEEKLNLETRTVMLLNENNVLRWIKIIIIRRPIILKLLIILPLSNCQ